MDPLLLKTLHVAGVIGLFTSMGAIIAGACEDCKKKAAMLHGISLLLILGVGLAMIFTQNLVKSGGWWHTKIVLWLFLGAAPALAKRGVVPRPVLLVLCLAAGILAAWLGIRKPF
ncbi:hypothetical protein KBB96_02260 [Luteolibacter ambystomatis]|uniref:Uncharacterized protein n=1 Tax=Luteolibacter ambystomatis TaxID=2824561 RepID=A0A975J0E7_9BACT|nr:hypothetical protein [Luteolibacter ambystomatis]QUE51723.1 hypothetical protein KBB96_02260 [Luteolibacter ambystomatis]